MTDTEDLLIDLTSTREWLFEHDMSHPARVVMRAETWIRERDELTKLRKEVRRLKDEKRAQSDRIIELARANYVLRAQVKP
jgi:PHD/YefM family antitoxin component YafN of YafNO toxin-antitoxin module